MAMDIITANEKFSTNVSVIRFTVPIIVKIAIFDI